MPYGLHSRELLTAVAPTVDGRVEIVNVDPAFAPRLAFSRSEEIHRDPGAWQRSWFEYIESPAVVAEVARNVDPRTRTEDRRGTLNYVRAGALRLHHALAGVPLPGLRMALNGNIAQGGGQSSSSALVVTTMLATLELAGHAVEIGRGAGFPACLPPTEARQGGDFRRALAEQCGEAEWYVGTRGGSGDHAAMLLGTREGLTHLCFRAPVGIRGIRYSRFPAGYQLIVANSQTRSEKSAEERLLFNRGIFAYRFAFLALKEEMRALGIPDERIRETESLGDIHTGRLSPTDIYRLVLRLPASVTPAEMAARFPQAFPAAARGCFGTDDPSKLPPDIPLRGAAVYGLGRVDRGWIMPELLERAGESDMREFGRLMSVTHDGDRVFNEAGEYTEGRSRLADDSLGAALTALESGEDRPLRHEPGFYGASIRELDNMVDIARSVDGVLGAGLMGAGGGGYILILARRGAFDRVRSALEQGYYRPHGKESDVEAWHPSAPAGRLL